MHGQLLKHLLCVKSVLLLFFKLWYIVLGQGFYIYVNIEARSYYEAHERMSTEVKDDKPMKEGQQKSRAK